MPTNVLGYDMEDGAGKLDFNNKDISMKVCDTGKTVKIKSMESFLYLGKEIWVDTSNGIKYEYSN